MAQIPSHKKKWYERKAVVELAGSIPPIIAAIFVAFAATRNPETKNGPWFWILGGSAIWLAGAAILKIIAAASEDEKKSPGGALHSALLVVHASVARHHNILDSESGALRITLHRVIRDKSRRPLKIEQVTRYVGGDGMAPGRTFPVQQGVGGKAVRTESPEILLFNSTISQQDMVEELKDKLGYVHDDAVKIVASKRLSFLAVPISAKDSKEVIGVVYCDSTRPDFFDQVETRLIINACHGVANYISEAYP